MASLRIFGETDTESTFVERCLLFGHMLLLRGSTGESCLGLEHHVSSSGGRRKVTLGRLAGHWSVSCWATSGKLDAPSGAQPEFATKEPQRSFSHATTGACQWHLHSLELCQFLSFRGLACSMAAEGRPQFIPSFHSKTSISLFTKAASSTSFS